MVKKRGKVDDVPNVQPLEISIPPIMVLASLVAVILLGVYLRLIPAQATYFTDPDTFHHYEVFKRVVEGNYEKFYPYVNPPTGDFISHPVGMYLIPATIYKLMSTFVSVETFFKAFLPVFTAISLVALYLLVREYVKNKIVAIVTTGLLATSVAHYYRSFGGMFRGDSIFMTFLLLTLIQLFRTYEKKEMKKVVANTLLFGFLYTLMLISWGGSRFGAMFFVGTFGITSIYAFIKKDNELLKKNVITTLLTLGVNLVLYGMTNDYLYRLTAELTTGVLFLTVGFLEFPEKVTFDRRIISASLLVTFAIALYLIMGSKILPLLSGAYQSTYVYQTVQELQATTYQKIKPYYNFIDPFDGDGFIYYLTVFAGFPIFIIRSVKKKKDMVPLLGIYAVFLLVSLAKPVVSISSFNLSTLGVGLVIILLYSLLNTTTNHKDIIVLLLFTMTIILAWSAVRFLSLASFIVIFFVGIFIDEIIERIKVADMKKNFRLAGIIVVLLVFIASIGVNAYGAYNASKSLRGAYHNGKYYGQITVDWENTLLWLKNTTNEYDIITSWWDYGYWIESSLLSHRPALIDGGYARDRDLLIGKMFASNVNDPLGEVDLETWQLKYVIAWRLDIIKFNAISYLGGAISEEEIATPTILPLYPYRPGEYVTYNAIVKIEGSTPYLYVRTYEGFKKVGELLRLEDHLLNQTFVGRGSYPYIGIIDNGWGLLVYYKFVNSTFINLAFYDGKNNPHFKQVYSSGNVFTYKFLPFVATSYNLSKGTITLSAYGRNIENAKIYAELQKGNETIKLLVAQNVNVDHTKDPEEVPINTTKILEYLEDGYNLTGFTLVQKGEVGILSEPPKFINNGEVKETKPSRAVPLGEEGRLIVHAKFDKDYENVELHLRVYAIITRDAEGYHKPYLMKLRDYTLATNLSTKNKEISIEVDVPRIPTREEVIREIDNTVFGDFTLISIRVEPVFVTEKEYQIYP